MTEARLAKVRRVLAGRQPDLQVFMEGVHKAHNYSAILRGCDSVGVGQAHALGKGTTAWHLKKDAHQRQEVSAGAAKWVHVMVHSDTASAYDHFRSEGLQICATTLAEDSVDFRQADYTKPTVVVMGTELAGLSEEGSRLADHRIHIPMVGMTQSLNVSVATAVVLFEAQRQRESAGMYDRKPESVSDDALFEAMYPEAAAGYRSRGEGYPELDEAGEMIVKKGFAGGVPG